MKKIFIAFTLLALCSFVLIAEDPVEMRPFTMPNTRSLGMGGSHVAYTDGVFSLFVNPAALQYSNEKSFFELGLGTHGPIIELADVVSAVQDGDDNAMVNKIGEFAKKSGGKIPLGLDVRFPLSIGYTANGLGFGLFDRVYVDAKIIGTDVELEANADVILNFGMSFNVFTFGKHVLDTGFVVKALARATTGIDESLLSFIDDSKIDSLTEDLTVPLVMGAGLDLGLTYRWIDLLPGNTLTAALVVDDLPTLVGASGAIYGSKSIPKYVIDPRVNIGAAYIVDFEKLAFVPIQAAFAIDYYDIARWFTPDDFTKRNPILNLSFGLEATFFKILSIRGGVNDMLPAVGLGVNLKGFRIEGAMYGKELGIEPGQLSTYAFDLSISIRPESKQRVWPWNKASIVDAVGSLFNKKAKTAD